MLESELFNPASNILTVFQTRHFILFESKVVYRKLFYKRLLSQQNRACGWGQGRVHLCLVTIDKSLTRNYFTSQMKTITVIDNPI